MDFKNKLPADKISKGYRLKLSTHQLIGKMKNLLDANNDTVLTMACEMLYKKIEFKKKTKLSRGNKISNKKLYSEIQLNKYHEEHI